MRILINIGLESNEGSSSYVFPKGIPADYVKRLFVEAAAPCTIIRSEVRLSNTEPTLILEVETSLPVALLNWLVGVAANLEQDAIAVYRPDVRSGKLVHQRSPKKHWGEFNPEYFLTFTE